MKSFLKIFKNEEANSYKETNHLISDRIQNTKFTIGYNKQEPNPFKIKDNKKKENFSFLEGLEVKEISNHSFSSNTTNLSSNNSLEVTELKKSTFCVCGVETITFIDLTKSKKALSKKSSQQNRKPKSFQKSTTNKRKSGDYKNNFLINTRRSGDKLKHGKKSHLKTLRRWDPATIRLSIEKKKSEIDPNVFSISPSSNFMKVLKKICLNLTNTNNGKSKNKSKKQIKNKHSYKSLVKSVSSGKVRRNSKKVVLETRNTNQRRKKRRRKNNTVVAEDEYIKITHSEKLLREHIRSIKTARLSLPNELQEKNSFGVCKGLKNKKTIYENLIPEEINEEVFIEKLPTTFKETRRKTSNESLMNLLALIKINQEENSSMFVLSPEESLNISSSLKIDPPVLQLESSQVNSVQEFGRNSEKQSKNLIFNNEIKEACGCIRKSGKSDESEPSYEFAEGTITDYIKIHYDSLDEDSSLGKEGFLLNIIKLIPRSTLYQFFNKKNNTQDKILLKWTFINVKDSVVFSLKDGVKEGINCLKFYPFKLSELLYRYLCNCPLRIEVYCGGVFLGQCNLMMKSSLEKVGITFEAALLVNNNDLVACGVFEKRCVFGSLVCRFGMRGDQRNFDGFKPVPIERVSVEAIGTGSFSSLFEFGGKKSISAASMRLGKSNDSEMQAFQDGLNLVLVRNKALHTTQDEISNELNERVTWMHQELKWRLTLQEHAILSGKDPHQIKWRQWKDEATAGVRYRHMTLHSDLGNEAKISITIEELRLLSFERFSSEAITQIYVEFSFVNISGSEMESVSVARPKDNGVIVYNFCKEIEIMSTDVEAKILCEMIRNNECISFTAVNEPELNVTATQNCFEIASCHVNLFDLVQSCEDSVTNCYSMYNDNYDAELASIKITFSGIFSMRALALHVLTPGDFNIIKN